MAASKLIPQEKGENTPLVLLQQLPDTGMWFELAEEREARLYLRAHCGWTWSQWKSMFSPFSQLTRFTAFLQHLQGEKNYKLPRNICWLGLNKGQKDCDCLSAAIKAPNPSPGKVMVYEGKSVACSSRAKRPLPALYPHEKFFFRKFTS